MKNLKNMVSAAGLMAIMVFGAVSANAELLNNDKTSNTTKSQCTVKTGRVLQHLASVIILTLSGITIAPPTPVCAETEEPVVPKRVRWS